MAVLPLAALLSSTGCTPEEDLVVEGDAIVSTEADLARIADATRITGALKVKRAGIASLHLPRLTEVGGRLSVQKNEKLTEVLLPALVSAGAGAGHEVLVERNYALESIDLRSLERAQDGLVVRHNPRLARLELGSLSRVGRLGVELASNDGIASLDLPALRSAPRLHVESCYRLKKLGIAALEEVGAVRIRANPSLAEIAEVPAAAQPRASSGGAAGKDAVVDVKDNFELPTCEGTRLVDRLVERGWKGAITVCGNKRDTCEPVGCEPAGGKAERAN
jgi:hypothetical protein